MKKDVVKGTFVVGDCTMGDGRPPWKRRADGNAGMEDDERFRTSSHVEDGYARSEG